MTRSRGVRPPERKPPKDQSSRGNSTQPRFSCLPPDLCPNGRTILLACGNITFGSLLGQFEPGPIQARNYPTTPSIPVYRGCPGGSGCAGAAPTPKLLNVSASEWLAPPVPLI